MKSAVWAVVGLVSLFFAMFWVLAVVTVLGIRDGSQDNGSPLAAVLFIPVFVVLFIVMAREATRD